MEGRAFEKVCAPRGRGSLNRRRSGVGLLIMSFLIPTQSYLVHTEPAMPRTCRGSCSSYTPHDLLLQQVYAAEMAERQRAAHRQQALRRKQQRMYQRQLQQEQELEMIQLVQQLAVQEAQRNAERRRAAIAEARRREALERRRAEEARQQQLAALQYARMVNDAQRLAYEEQEEEDEEPTYVRIGNMVLRIAKDEDEYSDAQEDVDEDEQEEEDEEPELQSLVDGVAKALVGAAPEPASERPGEAVPAAADEPADAAPATPVKQTSTAPAPAEPEPTVESPATPLMQSADIAEAARPSAPQLLFSRAFPAANTPYGEQVRKHAKADQISVEASPANGGSITIRGLWKTQAPASRPGSPRSPRAPRVSDVDENGEEVVNDADSDMDTAPAPLVMDDTDSIPLPALDRLDHVRAELTDDGFELWLD